MIALQHGASHMLAQGPQGRMLDVQLLKVELYKKTRITIMQPQDNIFTMQPARSRMKFTFVMIDIDSQQLFCLLQ